VQFPIQDTSRKTIIFRMASSSVDDLQRGEKIHADHNNFEKQRTFEGAPSSVAVPRTLGAGVRFVIKI
jgi:hypothetical protein